MDRYAQTEKISPKRSPVTTNSMTKNRVYGAKEKISLLYLIKHAQTSKLPA
jgi:hypothetical protein